jgi:2,4-dienoyl-CoA reductase-like NADH-dependent reductase (Old Yellow Enzyme family)
MEPAHLAEHDVKLRAVTGAISPLTRGMSSDELFSAAKLVGELMEHPGWERLTQLMERRKAHVFAQLVHGQTPEKHEYAALLSMLSGIDQMLMAGPVLKALSDQKVAELEQAQRAGEEQH